MKCHCVNSGFSGRLLIQVTLSYMQHPFDFMGKQCKIDLSVLHGFGGCAKRVNASKCAFREPSKCESLHIEYRIRLTCAFVGSQGGNSIFDAFYCRFRPGPGLQLRHRALNLSSRIAQSIEIWRWQEMNQEEEKSAKLKKIVQMVNESEIFYSQEYRHCACMTTKSKLH